MISGTRSWCGLLSSYTILQAYYEARVDIAGTIPVTRPSIPIPRRLPAPQAPKLRPLASAVKQHTAAAVPQPVMMAVPARRLPTSLGDDHARMQPSLAQFCRSSRGPPEAGPGPQQAPTNGDTPPPYTRRSLGRPPYGFTGIYDPLKEAVSLGHVTNATDRSQWLADGFALLDSVLSGDTPPPDWIWARDPEDFKGGQLAESAEAWEKFILPGARTSPVRAADIHRWIRDGVTIDDFFTYFSASWGSVSFNSSEPPSMRFPNHEWEPSLDKFMDDEIARMVSVDAATAVDRCPYLCMALGVEPKKPRMIADDRPLNAWCEPPRFRMDGLRDLARGLREGDRLISIDHKNGYYHLGIHPDSRRWMGFERSGQFYTYNVLPFGWNASCFIYQTLSSTLAAYLRCHGVHNVSYLDDFAAVISCSWSPMRQKAVAWAVPALHYLAGYTIGLPKCSLTPHRSLRHLGFMVDTKTCSFRILAEKRASRVAALTSIVESSSVEESWLRSEIGKLAHLTLALPPIPAFLRSFYDALTEHGGPGSVFRSPCLSEADRPRRTAYFSQRVTVTDLMREDAASLLGLFNRPDLLVRWPDECHAQLHMRMDTDASMKAWGAHVFPAGAPNSLASQGAFPDDIADEHITFKELYAIVAAIETFRGYLGCSFLDVHTDNTATQVAAATFRSRSPSMRRLLQHYAHLVLDLNLVVQVYRVTTKDNLLADGLSRFLAVRYTDSHLSVDGVEHGDHMLSKELFAAASDWAVGDFTLDVCANPRNKQVPRFISRDPADISVPGCVAVNVLAYPFPDPDSEFLYVNPPWILISALWRHLRLCHTSGALIFPDTPAAPWFGIVIQDCVEVGVLAEAGEVAFLQPSRDYGSSVGPLPWRLLVGRFDFSIAGATAAPPPSPEQHAYIA